VRSTKELPSVKRTKSGFASGVSFKSSLADKFVVPPIQNHVLFLLQGEK
jgi:hypothetical protein